MHSPCRRKALTVGAAVCFFSQNETVRGGIDPDGVWSYILIVLPYIWKIALLFEPAGDFSKRTRQRIEAFFTLHLRTLLDHRNKPGLHLLWSLFLFTHAVMDFLGSFLISLWVLLLGLVWGSLKILETRSLVVSPHYLGNDPSLRKAEDRWGFGQITPIVLLTIPVLQIVEAYSGRSA